MRGIQRGITTTFIVLVILAGTIAITAVYLNYFQTQKQKTSQINSFEDCTKLYPVMESYPEQCNTPDGKHFTSELSQEEKQRLENPTPSKSPTTQSRAMLSPSPSSYPSPSPLSMAECVEKYEGIRKGRIADSKNGMPFMPGVVSLQLNDSIKSEQQANDFITQQGLELTESSFSYPPYRGTIKVKEGQEASVICKLINTPGIKSAEMPRFLIPQ